MVLFGALVQAGPEMGLNPAIVMGMTLPHEAPFGSISEHFHGSGPGCLEELIWSAWGAHFESQGAQFETSIQTGTVVSAWYSFMGDFNFRPSLFFHFKLMIC